MNKIIGEKEINAVLQTVYQTNISVSTFDALKKLFIDLPNAQEDKGTDTKGDKEAK